MACALADRAAHALPIPGEALRGRDREESRCRASWRLGRAPTRHLPRGGACLCAGACAEWC
eukprot:635144-Alexandrium_andersonii.AAC.1